MSDGPFGLRIDGLEWQERLGRGGFSVVYRAHQTRLDRAVAVKVLTTDMSDPADARRFETECRLMGRLSAHRHIVDVHDAGIGSSGQPYIIMKYYTGGSLAAVVAERGPFPADDVIEIGAKLADALATAHAAGVIHRDVKAENVLLDEHGEPVMADFGVAAVADPDGRFTSSVAFSRAYVAPEVLDRNEYGTASDIYSLGATLYTLLSGRPVFAATSEARTVLAVLEDTPASIGRTDVPADLEALVLQCLAKEPEARPASAARLRDALRALPAAQLLAPPGAALHAEDRSESSEGSAPTHLVEPVDVVIDEVAAESSDVTVLRTARRGSVLPSTEPLSARRTDEGPTATAPMKRGRRNRRRVVTAPVVGLAVVLVVLVVTGMVWAHLGSGQLTGAVTTLAGSTTGYADGPGSSAQFHLPTAVSVTSDGTVVVADYVNNRIRSISPDGNVTTVAGSGPGYADGTGTKATFNKPTGVAVTADGTIIVADEANNRIRSISPDGNVTTLAGSTSGYADGPGTEAKFTLPGAVAVKSGGTVVVADTGNNRIRSIAPDGTVATVAGGDPGYADGQGGDARFLSPNGVAVAPDGSAVVADEGNHRVRRIT